MINKDGQFGIKFEKSAPIEHIRSHGPSIPMDKDNDKDIILEDELASITLARPILQEVNKKKLT